MNPPVNSLTTAELNQAKEKTRVFIRCRRKEFCLGLVGIAIFAALARVIGEWGVLLLAPSVGFFFMGAVFGGSSQFELDEYLAEADSEKLKRLQPYQEDAELKAYVAEVAALGRQLTGREVVDWLEYLKQKTATIRAQAEPTNGLLSKFFKR